MKVYVYINTCTRKPIVALFAIVKNWKQPNSPSTNLYIYAMESCAIIKSDELLLRSTIGINFKINMMSESRKYRPKMTTYWVILFI